MIYRIKTAEELRAQYGPRWRGQSSSDFMWMQEMTQWHRKVVELNLCEDEDGDIGLRGEFTNWVFAPEWVEPAFLEFFNNL